jgi:hypothetical protein
MVPPSLHLLGVTVLVAVILFPLPIRAADNPKALSPRTATLRGKVVSLAPLLDKFGARLDRDAAAQWMAFVTEDGTIYPLIKDDATRMFFQDHSLQNRPMQLTGRLIPGSQLLQAQEVRSIVNGQLCEVYYWCDICSIRRSEKKICECCGGPMILREDPVKK